MKIGSFPASRAGNGLSAFVGPGNKRSCSRKEPSGYQGCQQRVIYPPIRGMVGEHALHGSLAPSRTYETDYTFISMLYFKLAPM